MQTSSPLGQTTSTAGDTTAAAVPVTATPPAAYALAEQPATADHVVGGGRSLRWLIYAILLAGSLMFLTPFYFVINGSLKDEAAVQAGDFIRPAVPPTWLGDATKIELADAPATVGAKFAAAALGLGGHVEYVESRQANANVDQASKTEDEAGVGLKYAARITVPAKNTSMPSETFEVVADESNAPATTRPWTRSPNFANYPAALEKMGLMHREGNGWNPLAWSFPALSNTVVITTLTVLGQVISCSLVGFGFARFRFRGRGVLFLLMLSTMMLPAQVTLIPVFVLFKTLGMIDTIWPLVLPAWLASPFFVFMFRQFFAQVPEELIEAARIDGCSHARIYWQMMLPLSGPVIAIVAIYTFLGSWNDFLGPLIYLNSPENRTLSLALNAFKGQYGTTDAHLLMAASVVCMLPCVILFFAAQRYFVESVASTGLKA